MDTNWIECIDNDHSTRCRELPDNIIIVIIIHPFIDSFLQSMRMRSTPWPFDAPVNNGKVETVDCRIAMDFVTSRHVLFCRSLLILLIICCLIAATTAINMSNSAQVPVFYAFNIQFIPLLFSLLCITFL